MGVLKYLVRKQGVRVLIGVCVLVFFAAQTFGVTRWDFMTRLENFAYDKRLLLTMPRTADDRIVSVDIDEKSLAREGRWPWSRKTVARLMDQLFETYGVYVVGFDVVFAEPEENTALRLIQLLQQSELNDEPKFQRQLPPLREAFDHDRMFARSLEGRNVVLGLFFGDADASGEIPVPARCRRRCFPWTSLPAVISPSFALPATIVSEATRNAVPGYAYLELDRVRVKGKDEPVTIYEPVGLLEECDPAARQRLQAFSEVLRSYRAGMWDDAERRLKQLAELEPDCRLYSLYLERIAAYRASPPGGRLGRSIRPQDQVRTVRRACRALSYQFVRGWRRQIETAPRNAARRL